MLPDLGKPFRHRRLGGRAAGLPVLLALLASVAPLRGSETPVLARPPEEPSGIGPEQRPLVVAVESAAAAGMPALAESLAEDALARLPENGPAARRVRMAAATARLQRAAYAEAIKTLREIPGDDAAKNLRLALASYGSGKTADARKYLAATRANELAESDLVWLEVIEGLIASDENRANAAEQHFRSASVRAADNPLTLGQVTLLRTRMQLRSPSNEPDTLEDLGKLIELPDPRQSYQLAKSRAFAQYRAGRIPRAMQLMRAAPAPDVDLATERALIVGLMYGGPVPGSAGRHPEGRAELLSVIEAPNFPGSIELKSAALAALADAVISTTPSEIVANANAVHEALTNILSRHAASLAGGNIASVTDLILYTRARIMLAAATAAGANDTSVPREKAEQSLNELLEKHPASPLRADALRLTADLAWQSGAYRKAADVLEKLTALAPASETESLRLVAADCHFLYGDYARAAEGYARVRKSHTDGALRGEALVGEIRALIREERLAGDEPANAAQALADALAQTPAIPLEAVQRARWLLADALRKDGRYAAAEAYVNAGLAQKNTPEMHIRYLWLRAMIEIAGRRFEAAATTADAIAAAVSNPTEDTPESIRTLAPAILAQTALLRTKALLGANGLEGARAGFSELRDKFPDTASTAVSYLDEGRHLASLGRHAEALAVFRAGYDRFQNSRDPEILAAATAAQYEAAHEAIALADTRPDQLRVAFELLKTLTEKLAEAPRETLEKSLFFRARYLQGDILRRRGEFDSALKVYQDLVTQFPAHAERSRAELAAADCLAGLGDARPDRYPLALGAYERLQNLPGRTADLAAEAAYKRANTANLALEAAFRAANKPGEDITTATRLAQLAREEAAKSLWVTVNDLLTNPRETATLTPAGRYWIARAFLLISELYAANGRTVEARNTLDRLIQYNAGLPEGEQRLPGGKLAAERLRQLSDTAPRQPAP